MDRKDREIAVYKSALQTIKDIAFDYDGYEKADDLKGLIDELSEIASRALDGISPEYIGNGKVYNSLNEEIGTADDDWNITYYNPIRNDING